MIEMENCRKKLGRGVEFFCESFHAKEGERIALWGPSGCGKSTMLNLLCGMLQPDSGVIRVAGKEIQNLEEHERDRIRGQEFGFVFQTFNLLAPFTALENVILGMCFSDIRSPREWKPRAKELLERVGLAHRMHSKPSTMSVGEQQRVAIARAMANRHKIILADEPTGSLDPKTSQGVMDLLLTLCEEEGVTLLLVTHEQEIAERLPRRFDCSGLTREVEES